MVAYPRLLGSPDLPCPSATLRLRSGRALRDRVVEGGLPHDWQIHIQPPTTTFNHTPPNQLIFISKIL